MLYIFYSRLRSKDQSEYGVLLLTKCLKGIKASRMLKTVCKLWTIEHDLSDFAVCRLDFGSFGSVYTIDRWI